MRDIIFTSDGSQIESAFFGYGFQGTDLVIGHEGFRAFTESGRRFQSDNDGCYLYVQADGSGNTIFSTDFRGYFPLFYYSSGSSWIVSPSFELVARAARRRNLPLTLCKAQLDAWKSNSALLQAPTSERTPFAEIRLLSYDKKIIAGDKLIVSHRKRQPAHNSYETALSDLLAIWGGRIMTILDGGMAIRADLTGGVDSRTVFSVILHTLQMTGRCDFLSSEAILFNSDRRQQEDFAVACQISDFFGFPINNPNRRQYTLLEDETSYITWRRYNLARYSPHILPVASQDSTIITFNGVGGEDHRDFYESFGRGPLGEYIANFQPIFANPKDFGAWMGDLHADIDLPVTSYDSTMPAAVRHYRRHRSRHHTAKQPSSELMGVILGSRAAYECARFLDRDALHTNQLLFDIMINCSEDLAKLPYDQPEKAPQQINFDRLTRLKKIKPAQTGSIWRDPLAPSTTVKTQGRNIPLRKAVEEALRCPEVRELAGEAILQKLQQQLEKLTPTTNLHQNGHLIHYILLADVVCKYRTDVNSGTLADSPAYTN
uniref:hypothetical protein n=1 Tax=Paracoccus sp. TRP TaxID=412597 RepID=UPI00110F973C|nr:hypothetical protein [Paracoccus sp. TRP]